MANQIAGLRLTGTVTGQGNISLTSIVPNVGSLPASNLTVGQSGWCIIQAGSGATLQREISYCTYTADTPGAGILSRDNTKFSTSSNATINFAADTTVIVEFDVPDDNIPHLLGDGTSWHLLDELAAALGMDVTTDDQTVTAGNVNTFLNASTPNARYDFAVFEESDPENYIEGFVLTGPDAGGGSATALRGEVSAGGDFTFENPSGVTCNVRNNSGSSITFTKNVKESRAAS